MSDKATYDFFLAGVIQGSNLKLGVESQNYRSDLKEILTRRLPNRTWFCPVENHKDSPHYDDDQARDVFHHHLDLALDRCRCVIAYLPMASMGTAVEIWEAYKAGVPVLTITPMTTNWVVRICSTKVFENLQSFEEFCTEPNIESLGI